jgi:sugar/nucleoside kinase (ribokinase family)
VARAHDVVVLADLNPDVVVLCSDPPRFGQVEQLVDHARITLGGSGAITAAALAAQGVRVALCAAVGNDRLGALTTELVADLGVDVSGVVRRDTVATGMTVVLSRPDGDRALLTYPGTLAELTTDDVRRAGGDSVAGARHVHVSSFYLQRGLQAGLPELLRDLRDRGCTTSIDPGWDPAEQWRAIAGALPATSYLLPNAAEAACIAAALDPDAARSSTVVTKLGAEGAQLTSPDGAVQVSAAPVPVVDTTGAGDNFDAGFIAALLDGCPPREALARAVASGSHAIGGIGGTGRLADAAQVRAAARALLDRDTDARPAPARRPLEEPV